MTPLAIDAFWFVVFTAAFVAALIYWEKTSK